jgi:protein TonB
VIDRGKHPGGGSRWAIALLACACWASPAQAEESPDVAARPPAIEQTVIEDASLRGPSLWQRLAEIRQRVQRAKTYPPIARKRGVEGETSVAFEIDRSGTPHGIETVESSGHGALDRAALQAVERAGVLPWVYGRVTVPVRFTLHEAN